MQGISNARLRVVLHLNRDAPEDSLVFVNSRTVRLQKRSATVESQDYGSEGHVTFNTVFPHSVDEGRWKMYVQITEKHNAVLILTDRQRVFKKQMYFITIDSYALKMSKTMQTTLHKFIYIL